MLEYFTLPSEDRRLDTTTRAHLRGDFVELSDGVTHYELEGPADGDVAVLVGGLTIPLFYWDACSVGLHRRGVRTLAYSTYGRGYSDRVTARYGQELFVRQLAELTTALNVTSIHLVGTSMGALIAAAYLDRCPESIRTLILAGPAGLSNTATRQQKVLRSDLVATFIAKRFGRRVLLGHLSHNVSDHHLANELAAMITDSYRFQGSMYALFSTLQNFPLAQRAELYDRAARHAFPTLLLWGTEDRVTPISGFSRARTLLHPAEYHAIEHCGHMVPYECPDEVAERVAAFIARTDPDRTPT